MKTTLSRFFLLGTAALLFHSSANAQVVTTLTTNIAHPNAMVINALDTLYAFERADFKLKKIDPTGTVTSFVGSGIKGSADGVGAAASFGMISGMVLDAMGNIYATDYIYDKIRKITPNGVVSTFVSGLGGPRGIVWGKDDTLIEYNQVDGSIKKIAPSGAKVLFATTATECHGLAKGSNDTLYLAGFINHRIYKIDPKGTVTVFAGSGAVGSADGVGTAASFNYPYNIAVDGAGDLYVTDLLNYTIRKVTPAGVVTTFAGDGTKATKDGTGTAAQFYEPSAINISPSTGIFYISDFTPGAIRKMTGGIKVNINKYTLAASALKVYPSPFTDGFSISSSAAQRVQLMNNLGQIIQVIDIVAGEQQVSMAGQPAGIYYIKSDNGSAQRIVKL